MGRRTKTNKWRLIDMDYRIVAPRVEGEGMVWNWMGGIPAA